MAGWTHGQYLPSFCFTYFYTVPAREGLSDCVNLIPLFLYSQRLLLNPIGNIISRLKSFASFSFSTLVSKNQAIFHESMNAVTDGRVYRFHLNRARLLLCETYLQESQWEL